MHIFDSKYHFENKWESEQEANLLFSLLLRPEELKATDAIKDYIENELQNNHEVIYIGIHNHPEATASISRSTEYLTRAGMSLSLIIAFKSPLN